MERTEFWQIKPVQAGKIVQHGKQWSQVRRHLKTALIGALILGLGFFSVLARLAVLPDQICESVSPARIGSAVITTKLGFMDNECHFLVRDFLYLGNRLVKLEGFINAEGQGSPPTAVIWSHDGYVVAVRESFVNRNRKDKYGRATVELKWTRAYDFQKHAVISESTDSDAIVGLLKAHGGVGPTADMRPERWRQPYLWESY